MSIVLIVTAAMYLSVAAAIAAIDWVTSLDKRYGEPSVKVTLIVGFGWPAYALFWLGEIVYFKVKDMRS